MAKIIPFKALRPQNSLASEVASVPYDVVSSSEAREIASDRARNFLHVTKPEIDMPEGVDPYSDEVYQKGRQTLDAFIDEKTLVLEKQPSLYLYSLSMGGHTQTGVVMLASVDEYNANLVKKHEHTRPDKEDDRVRHMRVLGAQSGTVFLVHRDSTRLAELIKGHQSQAPDVDFETLDGVRHRVWTVIKAEDIGALEQAFADNGPLYIADGHHRSAAGARVAGEKELKDAGFLAVSFPISEINILPYNRVVTDLNGLTTDELLGKLEHYFEVAAGKPKDLARGHFALFVDDKWFSLRIRPQLVDAADPVQSLDVSLLQEFFLAPLLNIQDPRRDKRIEFVGGIRGDDELEKRVKQGKAMVALALHPTSIEDLLRIADNNEVMPPKSTWFEPKLRDGLFVHMLERR
jgi:uncharacterized protein (DUF1015 family)